LMTIGRQLPVIEQKILSSSKNSRFHAPYTEIALGLWARRY
jgi:hypothetical protein